MNRRYKFCCCHGTHAHTWTLTGSTLGPFGLESRFAVPCVRGPRSPYRRKFRSQTSDNMDRWKSRGGKSQRTEEKKKDQRRERVIRKKMQAREKVEQLRNGFPMVWGSGGSK